MRWIACILTMNVLSIHAQDCTNAPILNEVQIQDTPSDRFTADGSLSISYTSGTPTSLVMTGLNGSDSYVLPIGLLIGIAPGNYTSALIDGNGCISNSLDIIVPYSLCCDSCGIGDVDTDGICDNTDSCTNRHAENFNDPANGPCVIFGCTNPTFTEYDEAATIDDGSCLTECTPPNFDGYTYDVVIIGNQCWFAENLRTTTYQDGSLIDSSLDSLDWATTINGAVTVYGEGELGCQDYHSAGACEDSIAILRYGRLYNWHAVDDPRKLCPLDWHVPAHEDWIDLESFMASQGITDLGTALKSSGGWDYGNGTNAFGFNGMPGGYRGPINSGFAWAGIFGTWWSWK